MSSAAAASLDALPCGFLQLDGADRIVVWNRQLENWTGRPRTEAVGQLVTALYPQAPALPRLLAEVRASGQPRVLAQMFHHWLIPIDLAPTATGPAAAMQQECHLVPLAAPPGHLAISILDVTALVAGQQRSHALVAERSAALQRAEQALRELGAREEALRESEALLREHQERLDLALAAAHTCTWDNDMSRNFLRLDERWSTMLGGPPVPTETASHLLLRLIHPADRATMLREIRECYERNAENYNLEHRVRRHDGRWIWVHSAGRVVSRDAAGRAVRVIGTNTDITARKQAELLILRQKTFLSALQETTLELLAPRELRDLFQTLVERTCAIMQAPLGELMLKEGDELVVCAFTGDQPYSAGPRLNRSDASLSWQAHDTRQPATCADYRTWPHRQEAYADRDLHAAAEFPILHGSNCVGVLAVARSLPDFPFSAEDLQKGSLLAQMAALVLLNATLRDTALREAAERTTALRESEEKFRCVFDQSPIIIGLLSIPEGRVVEINAAGLAAFQITREDVIGRTSKELGIWVNPDDRIRYLEKLQSKGFVTGFEAQMRSRNGEIFTVLYSGSRVTIAGRPYSLNSLQDITARKKSEAARDHSLSLMGATLESTADGILVADAEDRIVTWNQTFVRMWNLSEAELLAGDKEAATKRILAQLTLPEQFLSRLAEVRTQPTAPSADLVAFNDGRVLECFSRPQMLNGQPVGRVWSFRDITQRQHDEAALRESEERFRALADVSPVGIFSSDRNGRCVFVNRRWCEFAGLTPEQAQGDGWLEALHPEDRPAIERGWADAAPIGESSTAEFRFRRPDGTITWLVGQSRAQRNADGTILGHVGTVTDVTHLKRAEQERERSESRLRETQRLESLGTLAGGIAHDFNNILTGIFGFVDLARLELPTGHPARVWLDQMNTAGARAKELVRQILTFSRRNEGERRPERLDVVVAEALRLLRSTLPAMVTLDQCARASCPPVLADATQIHQVIMNLCTNGWHALPARGGRITVTLQPCTLNAEQATQLGHLTAGAYVRLSVADTGCGMTPETLARIFDPFFTTKEPGKGTGLGLAVVHGIVKSHGGAITVESQLGLGTTFDLYFPALVATPPVAPETPPRPAPRGSGERILLIDDDKVSGLAIQKLIESLGYAVTRFTTPAEAVAHFRTDPSAYDLIVTDLAMPAMPGDALAEEVTLVRPTIPVILITGFVEPARQAALEASGISAVIRKPPSRGELAEVLARQLSRPKNPPAG